MAEIIMKRLQKIEVTTGDDDMFNRIRMLIILKFIQVRVSTDVRIGASFTLAVSCKNGQHDIASAALLCTYDHDT